MKNNFVFFVLILLLYSCHHIDDTKYEKIYFQDLIKTIENQTSEDSQILKESEKKELSPQIPENVLEKKTEITKIKKTETKPEQPQKTIKKKAKIGELTIESDTMTFNKETSMAVFINNVKLKAQGVNLFCDKLQSVNYRDNAEATGNVRVNYLQQNIKIKCGKVKYNKALSKIEAYENVVAEKILDKNEKISLYADEIKYDMERGVILATKVNKKVKIKLKDIVVFADEVIYNEITEELEFTGNPFARKQESTFISSKIKIDVNKKIIKLQKNIWAKLFYTDFEDIKKEVSVEKDSN